MMKITETIVALSTPPGLGAIAVIRLAGSDAIAITDRIFRGKKLADVPTHTLHFGVIEKDGVAIDEVVVSVFRGPKSYTGDDVIEISCHGSPYIQQQILSLLIAEGARMAKPGEFTLRAFLNGKMDLSQAEAVADLIASENAASHDLAMQQMRGGYSDELKNLRYKLIEFAALIELELDFSEEDVEFANRDQLVALTNRISRVINQLIDSFQLGNVIKKGVQTVIAGRPNAGKSTLLNALLNEERAIVSEIAGTTRDTIEEELNIHGIQFRLIDTAGIREATDAIERAGVERTMEKIERSTLLLYVFDIHAMGLEEVAADLASFNRGNYSLLLVANKMDQGLPAEKVLPFDALGDIHYISSKEGTNLEDLKEAMYARIAGDGFNRGNVIVSNARHLEALLKAKESLADILASVEGKASGEITALSIRSALNYLGEITGEVTNEDLLDFIFSKFCIGK
jgi:tRNA modification GTPase